MTQISVSHSDLQALLRDRIAEEKPFWNERHCRECNRSKPFRGPITHKRGCLVAKMNRKLKAAGHRIVT